MLSCWRREPLSSLEEEALGTTGRLVVAAGHVVRDDGSALGNVYFLTSAIPVFAVRRDRLRRWYQAPRFVLLGEPDAEQRQLAVGFLERRFGLWRPLPPLRLRVLGSGRKSLPFNGALNTAIDIARRRL